MELLLIRGEPVPVDGKNQLKSVDLVNTLLLPKDKYKVAQKALSNIPYVFDIQEVVGKIATATKIDPQLIWKQLTWKERVSRHTTKKKARVDEPKRQQGGPHQGPQRDFQEVHPKEQMVEVFDDEDLFDDDDDEDDDFESEGKGKEDLQEEEIHQEQQQQLSSGDIAAMLQINANVLTALAAFAKTEEDQKSPLSVQIKTIGLLFAQAILELGPLTIAKKAGGGLLLLWLICCIVLLLTPLQKRRCIGDCITASRRVGN